MRRGANLGRSGPGWRLTESSGLFVFISLEVPPRANEGHFRCVSKLCFQGGGERWVSWSGSISPCYHQPISDEASTVSAGRVYSLYLAISSLFLSTSQLHSLKGIKDQCQGSEGLPNCPVMSLFLLTKYHLLGLAIIWRQLVTVSQETQLSDWCHHPVTCSSTNPDTRPCQQQPLC